VAGVGSHQSLTGNEQNHSSAEYFAAVTMMKLGSVISQGLLFTFSWDWTAFSALPLLEEHPACKKN